MTTAARWSRDVRLGLRIAAMRGGGLALALRGDPVARLMHRPWRHDPYPVYARLRADGGLSRSRTGISVVATHDLCTAVLRDRTFGVRLADGRLPFTPESDPSQATGDVGDGGGDAAGAGRTQPPSEDGLMGPLDLSLLELDAPDHGRLRRLAQPTFAPRRLEQYRVTTEKITGRLLDAAGERFDLVRGLAAPLPITVISELLGIPDVDAPRFARWGRALGSALDGVQSVRHARALRAATADLRALFVDLVARRRADPGEDVISGLVGALDDEALTLDELVALAQLLLVAGFETTTNLVGNAVRALTADPGQWRALVDDPSLAAAAVEETLRFDPPVQLTARFAHADTEVGGRPMRRDSGVLVLLASAGRDPAVHADPDRFDLHRAQAAPHLAFSGGAHYCLGAPLARLEGEVALRTLAERMPRLRPAGTIVPRTATVLRGPRRFPVQA